MAPELFEKAVSQYAEMGGRAVNLTPIVGEPLLDPHLMERIRAAKSYKLSVSLITNGLLLNRLDLERLVTEGLDSIAISCAPFEEEAHRRIYRTDQYHCLLEGIKRLLSIRNSTNSDTRICFLVRSDVPKAIAEQFHDWISIRSDLRKHEKNAMYQIAAFDSW